MKFFPKNWNNPFSLFTSISVTDAFTLFLLSQRHQVRSCQQWQNSWRFPVRRRANSQISSPPRRRIMLPQSQRYWAPDWQVFPNPSSWDHTHCSVFSWFARRKWWDTLVCCSSKLHGASNEIFAPKRRKCRLHKQERAVLFAYRNCDGFGRGRVDFAVVQSLHRDRCSGKILIGCTLCEIFRPRGIFLTLPIFPQTDGSTPLSLATHHANGKETIVRMLIQAKANVNAQNFQVFVFFSPTPLRPTWRVFQSGMSALMCAGESSNLNIFLHLLQVCFSSFNLQPELGHKIPPVTGERSRDIAKWNERADVLREGRRCRYHYSLH